MGPSTAIRVRDPEHAGPRDDGLGTGMSTSRMRKRLEGGQVAIYFAAVASGAVAARAVPGTASLEALINPTLALMLLATFLQVPVADLGRCFARPRFLLTLLGVDFVLVPALVAVLVRFAPDEAMVRLGVSLVLLCPCIDYVVTFSHLGRADAENLLAATPILLLLQLLLLPIQLRVLLGSEAPCLVQAGPFLWAFLDLIVIPLALALVVQLWAGRTATGRRVLGVLGLSPVPATALVLLVVSAAVVPRLDQARDAALRVVPIYVAFAILAPSIGWFASRVARLPAEAGRAVAFSAATRNSLVVLPLALAVPGAVPILPAIIVAQTMVELLAELVLVRMVPRARMGWIIMEPADTPPMSGSNSICVSMVLLDTGIVPMQEPITRMMLEAPGGVVEVEAECRDGKAERIHVRNVPSFADKLDVDLEVAGVGTVKVDTAYGGDSFVLVDAAALGLELTPDQARDVAQLGVRVTKAANEQLGFSHPANDWSHISFCQITNPVESRDGVLWGKNAVAIRPGKVDRSPTGTGCSARMAVLHAKGLMKVGDRFVGRSIIDTEFHCRLDAEVEVGGKAAISPIISGRAWVIGTKQLMVDPSDPFQGGYRLSDTWPTEP